MASGPWVEDDPRTRRAADDQLADGGGSAHGSAGDNDSLASWRRSAWHASGATRGPRIVGGSDSNTAHSPESRLAFLEVLRERRIGPRPSRDLFVSVGAHVDAMADRGSKRAPWRRLRRRSGLSSIQDRLAAIEKRLVVLSTAESRYERTRGDVGRLDYPHAEIYLRLRSGAELVRTRSAAKEPWTVDWIDALGPDHVLYDVGANVGPYALIAAKGRAGVRRVIAIEPSYVNFAALCDNLLLNDCGDRVLPLQVALAESTGLGTLSYGELQAGAARNSLSSEATLYETFAPAHRQAVLTLALDDLVERFEVPAPTHVKLDVDGTEVDVLSGAGRTLRHPRLESVLVESEETEEPAVTPLLEAAGLRLGSRFGTPGKSYGYFLYERGEARG